MEEHYINQFILNGTIYSNTDLQEYLDKAEFYLKKLMKLKGFSNNQECFDYMEHKLS